MGEVQIPRAKNTPSKRGADAIVRAEMLPELRDRIVSVVGDLKEIRVPLRPPYPVVDDVHRAFGCIGPARHAPNPISHSV
jgi:hypothetical protein